MKKTNVDYPYLEAEKVSGDKFGTNVINTKNALMEALFGGEQKSRIIPILNAFKNYDMDTEWEELEILGNVFVKIILDLPVRDVKSIIELEAFQDNKIAEYFLNTLYRKEDLEK